MNANLEKVGADLRATRRIGELARPARRSGPTVVTRLALITEEMRIMNGRKGAGIETRKSKIENPAHFHSTSAPRLRRFSTKFGWARLMVSAFFTIDLPSMLAATM